MTGHGAVLSGVLRREAAKYKNLARLADEQREILVAGRMEELQANVKKQEKEMFALGPLSEERNDALLQAAKELGAPNAPLADVAAGMEGEDGEELRAALKEVVEAARALDRANKGNTKLLENAASYVAFTLEALQGKGMGKIPNYQPSGGSAAVNPAPPPPPAGGTQWTA